MSNKVQTASAAADLNFSVCIFLFTVRNGSSFVDTSRAIVLNTLLVFFVETGNIIVLFIAKNVI